MVEHLRAELEEQKQAAETLRKQARELKRVNKTLAVDNEALEAKLKIAAGIEDLDLSKLGEMMSSQRRIAGALEAIRNTVKGAAAKSAKRLRKTAAGKAKRTREIKDTSTAASQDE